MFFIWNRAPQPLEKRTSWRGSEAVFWNSVSQQFILLRLPVCQSSYTYPTYYTRSLAIRFHSQLAHIQTRSGCYASSWITALNQGWLQFYMRRGRLICVVTHFKQSGHLLNYCLSVWQLSGFRLYSAKQSRTDWSIETGFDPQFARQKDSHFNLNDVPTWWSGVDDVFFQMIKKMIPYIQFSEWRENIVSRHLNNTIHKDFLKY